MDTIVATRTQTQRRTALRVVQSHHAQPAPGLDVLRPFPGPQLDYASPFLMLDHFGPERIRPGDKGGLNPHPHRGFETVTFLFQGAMEHHDSSGGHGLLNAGGVQWMTAGSGIVHAEYRQKEFARTGGVLEGVQLWVNLPRKFKMEAPHYQDLPAEKFAVAKFAGGVARVVAGELLGVRGPAVTYTSIVAAYVKLEAGASVELPRVRARSRALGFSMLSRTSGSSGSARSGAPRSSRSASEVFKSRPVSRSQMACMCARSRSSFVRSRRGVATWPETMRSGRLKKYWSWPLPAAQ